MSFPTAGSHSFFLGNLTQSVLRHHERGAWAQSAPRGEFLFRHRQSLTWLLLFVILTGKVSQSIQHQPEELLGMEACSSVLNLGASLCSLLGC